MSDDISKQSKGIYHQVYLSKVASAIQACQSLATLSHSGEKGRLREVLLRSMFRPLLPADLGVGTGFVVASDGQQSAQQDIVIYDRLTLPPAMVDDETGLFPIEAVLWTIEVKSTLTRHDLKTAHENARKLARFPLVGKDSSPVQHGPRPHSTIFALASDLADREKDEINRYLDVRRGDPPYLSALCVVGRGYWWFQDLQVRRWPEQYALSEVIGFLGGIMNKVPQMFEERRARRPALGVYLIDFGADISAVLNELVDIQSQARAAAQRGVQGRHELLACRQRLRKLESQLDAVATGYARLEDDGAALLFRKLRQMHHEAVTTIDSTLTALDKACHVVNPGLPQDADRK